MIANALRGYCLTQIFRDLQCVYQAKLGLCSCPIFIFPSGPFMQQQCNENILVGSEAQGRFLHYKLAEFQSKEVALEALR